MTVVSTEIDQHRRLKLPTLELEKALAQHTSDKDEDREAVQALVISLIETLEQLSSGLAIKSSESSRSLPLPRMVIIYRLEPSDRVNTTGHRRYAGAGR